MDDLTTARDTNRRLNRRLGDMENDLHSMVSLAQHETTMAQRELGALQSRIDYWVKRGAEYSTEIAHLKDKVSGLRTSVMFFRIWSVVTTTALIWLAVR